MEEIAYTFLSGLSVMAVIIVLWYALWKLVLEPNPLVRDFFDLDRKPIGKKRSE